MLASEEGFAKEKRNETYLPIEDRQDAVKKRTSGPAHKVLIRRSATAEVADFRGESLQ